MWNNDKQTERETCAIGCIIPPSSVVLTKVQALIVLEAFSPETKQKLYKLIDLVQNFENNLIGFHPARFYDNIRIANLTFAPWCAKHLLFYLCTMKSNTEAQFQHSKTMVFPTLTLRDHKSSHNNTY